jgi:hypothetical protein
MHVAAWHWPAQTFPPRRLIDVTQRVWCRPIGVPASEPASSAPSVRLQPSTRRCKSLLCTALMASAMMDATRDSPSRDPTSRVRRPRGCQLGRKAK